MTIKFKSWPKIPRWENQKWTVTEKIDGTNACIVIDEEGNIGAQARQALITPDKDNFGFAQWVQDNKEELLLLGEGHHYGEWYGRGIQRNYGLKERRFALFSWWRKADNEPLPSCVETVPYLGSYTADSSGCWDLQNLGSRAVEGWKDPEGYILTNSHDRQLMYKIILRKDRNGNNKNN